MKNYAYRCISQLFIIHCVVLILIVVRLGVLLGADNLRRLNLVSVCAGARIANLIIRYYLLAELLLAQ